MTFSHFDDIYPSVQNGTDCYLTMGHGGHVKLWTGWVSGVQITARLHHNPARGTRDTEQLYRTIVGDSCDTALTRSSRSGTDAFNQSLKEEPPC